MSLTKQREIVTACDRLSCTKVLPFCSSSLVRKIAPQSPVPTSKSDSSLEESVFLTSGQHRMSAANLKIIKRLI